MKVEVIFIPFPVCERGYVGSRCMKWSCDICSDLMRWRLYVRCYAVEWTHFLHLTVNAVDHDPGDFDTKLFHRYNMALRKHFGKFEFFRVVHLKPDRYHYHLLISCPDYKGKEFRFFENWHRVCGYVSRVQLTRGITLGAISYCLNYSAKDKDFSRPEYAKYNIKRYSSSRGVPSFGKAYRYYQYYTYHFAESSPLSFEAWSKLDDYEMDMHRAREYDKARKQITLFLRKSFGHKEGSYKHDRD